MSDNESSSAPQNALISPGSVLFGSVCSGIEAASVAWHPLGWRAAWLAEIEPFPSSVLAHHYPDVTNLGDMTKIAALVRAGAVAAPDVLVGGTPCQAFSVAGLRQSLDDARGQLSLSFVDLANAIDTARLFRCEPAAVIVWENVPGVLSTKDNAFGCFLGALSGEDEPVVPAGGKWTNAGCVFGPQRTVAWRVLDAQFFGVAQRRRRVFVIASARDDFDPTAVLFECDGVRRDIAPSREKGKEVAGTLASRTGGGGFPGSDEACSGYVQPVTGLLEPKVDAYGFQARIGRNGRGDMGDVCAALTSQAGETGKGDSAPCVAIAIQNATRGKSQNGLGIGADGDPMYTLDQASQHGVAQSFAYAIQAGALRTNPNSGPDGVGVQPHIAYTLEARAEVQAVAFCQNTRDEVRLMGGDGQIVGALSAQPGMKQTCYVAQCVTGDITHMLKAEGFDANEDGTGRGQPIVACAFDILGSPATEVAKATDVHTPLRARIPGQFENSTVTMVLTAQAIAFQERGREGGRNLEINGDLAYALTAPANGGRAQERNIATAYTTKLHNTTSNQAGKIYEEYTVSLGANSPPPALLSAMAVRRLTPRECERLQGFPDDYTLVPGKRKNIRPEKLDVDYLKYLARGGVMTFDQCMNVAADGPRYKSLGNSMCVNVMAWLGRRIDTFLN